MSTHDFNEIKDELASRANKLVWCNAATVDGRGRPRSRLVHPVWEGQIAWLTTNPTSYKTCHLARAPYISLAYIDPVKPAYADCVAEWVDDLTVKQHVWDYVQSIPEPMGFDPATIWDPIDGPPAGKQPFGLLKLTPYRITLTQWPQPQVIWTPAEADGGDV